MQIRAFKGCSENEQAQLKYFKAFIAINLCGYRVIIRAYENKTSVNAKAKITQFKFEKLKARLCYVNL